jgi:iron complex transport system substrate-binding protein
MARFKLLLVSAALLAVACGARAEISVRDATGAALHLPRPAQRIVSLAPHVTELLYAAGAGTRIVGAVEYSNYPEAAKKLPRVGSNAQVDLEAVAALKPDLIVGWASGNPPAAIAKLRALKLPLYLTQPNRIGDIPATLENLGRLAGTQEAADAAAAAFRARHARLAERYSQQPRLRVFYEIWKQPLMTVNGEQIISDAIRLCGGENVFADLPVLAPTVSVEAVLAANPDVIVASGMDEARPEWLDDWRRWPGLAAAARGNLYFVPPDLIQRHTPRVLDGAERLCGFLEEARKKR